MSEVAENAGWLTPTKVGFALTALVLAGFVYMAWQRNCVLLPSEVLECQTNWAWFLSSPPNEVGDTLAGFAGALALIWIIITVWIQGHELREQRKELELTRTELTLAREAQEKQLEVMQKQADIFEDEKKQRVWDRSKETLDELIKQAVELMLQNTGAQWIFIYPVERLADGRKTRREERFVLFEAYGGELDYEQYFRDASLNTKGNLNLVDERRFDNLLEMSFSDIDLRALQKLQEVLSSIKILARSLGPAELVRIERIRVDSLVIEIERALNCKEIQQAMLEGALV